MTEQNEALAKKFAAKSMLVKSSPEKEGSSDENEMTQFDEDSPDESSEFEPSTEDEESVNDDLATLNDKIAKLQAKGIFIFILISFHIKNYNIISAIKMKKRKPVKRTRESRDSSFDLSDEEPLSSLIKKKLHAASLSSAVVEPNCPSETMMVDNSSMEG